MTVVTVEKEEKEDEFAMVSTWFVEKENVMTTTVMMVAIPSSKDEANHVLRRRKRSNTSTQHW